jgi:hypothetical protein
MMEAARASETSVDNYFTRQYIPEDNSELHTSFQPLQRKFSMHLISPMRTASSAHLILLDFITLLISGEEYKL